MKTNTNYFLVLDIETSTLIENEQPTAVWLAYAYINLYYKDGTRVETNYFRTWKEYKNILDKYINRFLKYRLYCFIHNLGYEFDFLLKNVGRPVKMLTNSAHKVIMARLEGYENIEYRCTLMLAMKSLSKIGDELSFPKLDSDYRFILPSDNVTEKEKIYCIRDCDIVAKYVVERIKEFSSLREIPYTKTGRVRKKFKEFYDDEYQAPEFWDYPPPADCYQAMLDAFCGGCVFSNPYFTARIIRNVHSYDITSSYPFAMLSELFPYTIEKQDVANIYDLEKPFWIAKIKFRHIRSKFAWNWLSISKMNEFDMLSSEWFNGKLISSDWIIRTITNIDYELICKTYTFDKLKHEDIIEFYDCKNYSELPYPYIQTIIAFGTIKSEYKNLVKSINEDDPNWLQINAQYNLSKNDFNAIYGMSVQKLMQAEYTIDEYYQWHEMEKEYVQKNKPIKRNFLYGIYITAYARRNLINAILQNCPHTFVYCDTDSVKFIGENKFINTNKPLPEKYAKIEALSELGQFDHDGEYDRFVTYGAKKYAYSVDGKIHLTVAGLPKYKDGNMDIIYNGEHTDRLNTLENFRIGTIFHNCKHAHKFITTKYSYDLDDNRDKINMKRVANSTLDYLREHKIETCGGVVIYDVDYELDITHQDRHKILECQEELKWGTNPNITTVQEYFDTKCLIE